MTLPRFALLLLPLLALVALAALPACTADNQEDLFPDDSTQVVSYTQDVQPVLDANCTSCHQAGLSSGGVRLDSYTDVKRYADNGQLVRCVQWESCRMPPSGPLAPTTITLLERWVQAGAPNN